MSASMPPSMPPSLRAFGEPRLQAMVELMYLAASADGDFSKEERAHFLSSVESLTDRQISGSSLDRLVARFEADLRKDGRDVRLASIRERLESIALRKVGLSLVVAVIVADGIIRTTEREALLEMADALEISRDEAADLVAQHAPT
ncbi:tellurite resistance TerB family protein [Chondromyces apiculatus]|nr:tellurite resistance TerB family protein [Chondromyces apiculatus]